jgi:hypothetical protein
MTKDDFQKGPFISGEIEFWYSRPKVQSKLGAFDVILEMLDEGDHNPPDDRMIMTVNELIAFFQARIELIEAVVFGAYLYLSRTSPRELELSGVPRDLPKGRIKKHLSGLKLVVSRHMTGSKFSYETRVLVIPDWDHEHALNMTVFRNEITEINGYKYEFEAEELHLF